MRFKLLTNGQLNNLVKSGIVQDYPPLVDEKGSYTAQFEHVSNSLSVINFSLLMYLSRPFCSGPM